MDLHREAEAHLRTIRTLMERATVYRAISAPTALVAAVLGIGCGLIPQDALPDGGNGWDFKALWLTVLAVTLIANAVFIFRGARRRGDPFRSPGMRLVAGAVAPPALCGLLATVILPPTLLPAVWMVCYGLALLATATFAPRSIVYLGYVFLANGLLLSFRHTFPGHTISQQETMLWAFGGLHLIYAVFVWRRDDSDRPADLAPDAPGSA